MTQSDAERLAENAGFSSWGIFDAGALRFLPEVRGMCEDDRCGKYNRRWTCPPACGTLGEITARASKYGWGILLQTTGRMEDAFDAETLVEAMDGQAAHFREYTETLRSEFPEEDFLPMSSGGCELCPDCTWPDAPCRHPEEAVPSMEAYGLLVTEVCEAAGIPYYYGRNTITFSSCVLFY